MKFFSFKLFIISELWIILFLIQNITILMIIVYLPLIDEYIFGMLIKLEYKVSTRRDRYRIMFVKVNPFCQSFLWPTKWTYNCMILRVKRLVVEVNYNCSNNIWLGPNITTNVILYIFSSFQFSSVAQSCPTLCDPMNRSTPGLPVHHQLPEFTQTHVHRVGDAIQPSHPLSSPSPPAPNPSQHQSLFQGVSSLHEVAKVLKFQL